MATIDVGAGATNRASTYSTTSRTVFDAGNPANDTGTLDTLKIYANSNMGGVKIGTFYPSSAQYKCRDYETIGDVASGSEQTFSGKNCDVTSGDFLGVYWTSGALERDTDGYTAIYYYGGDATNGNAYTYKPLAGDALSIYATGATVAAGNPYYYYLNQ